VWLLQQMCVGCPLLACCPPCLAQGQHPGLVQQLHDPMCSLDCGHGCKCKSKEGSTVKYHVCNSKDALECAMECWVKSWLVHHDQGSMVSSLSCNNNCKLQYKLRCGSKCMHEWEGLNRKASMDFGMGFIAHLSTLMETGLSSTSTAGLRAANGADLDVMACATASVTPDRFLDVVAGVASLNLSCLLFFLDNPRKKQRLRQWLKWQFRR
jgi:hypothetical protein